MIYSIEELANRRYYIEAKTGQALSGIVKPSQFSLRLYPSGGNESLDYDLDFSDGDRKIRICDMARFHPPVSREEGTEDYKLKIKEAINREAEGQLPIELISDIVDIHFLQEREKVA